MKNLKYLSLVVTLFLNFNFLYAFYSDSTQNESEIIPEKKSESYPKTQILTKEDIFKLPIRNFAEIVTAIPNYTINERNFIPAYRRDKLEFLEFNLDGFSIEDFRGNFHLAISKYTIEALQMINSESDISFSKLSNGGINIITTPTKSTYFGSFEYLTDNFLFNGIKGLRSSGTEITNLSIGGPVLPHDPKLFQFFGSFEYSFERDPYWSYYSENLRNFSGEIWEKFKFFTINYIQRMTRRDNFTPEQIGSPEYNATAERLMLTEPRWNKVKIGQIPDAFKLYYSWNEKLAINLDNLKFIISGFSTRMKSRMVLPNYTLMNSFNHPLLISNSDMFYLKSTYNVTTNLNINFGISYSNIYSENSHPVHRKNYFDYGDYYKNPLFANYINIEQHAFRVPMDPFIGKFSLPGRIYNFLGFSKNQILQVKSDLNYKYNNHNFILGFEFKVDKIRKYEIAPLSLAIIPDSLKNIIKTNPDALDSSQSEYIIKEFRARAIDIYGYDYFGREVNNKKFDERKRIEGPKNPIYGALYLQDRIQFDLICLNLGLRVDVWDLNDYEFKDLYDLTNSKNTRLYGSPENFKQLFPDQPIPKDGWGDPNKIEGDSFIKTKPSISLNPRAGISFNIPEYRTILFINYQTFTHLDYDQIFSSMDKLMNVSFVPIKSCNIKPLYTNNFEIGINRLTKNNVHVNLTGFQRITMRNLENQYINTNTGTYLFQLNGYRYEVVGSELSILTPAWKNITGKFNYTYTYKTYSKFKYEFYDDYHDQHSVLINLIYNNYPLGINLLFRTEKSKNLFAPLLNYTYEPFDKRVDTWKQQFDLKLFYNFKVRNKVNFIPYAEIKNLLNHKNQYYEIYTGAYYQDIIQRLIQQGNFDELPVLLGLINMVKHNYTYAGYPRSLKIGLLVEF